MKHLRHFPFAAVALVAGLASPSLLAQNTHRAELNASASQYFATPDSSSLSIIGDLTIEAWIKAGSFHSNADVFVVGKNGGSNGAEVNSYAFGIHGTGGTLSLSLEVSTSGSNNQALRKNYAFSTGVWYHVAVSRTASTGTVEFFVNGNSIGTVAGTTAPIFDNDRELDIGRVQYNYSTADGGSGYFDGYLDEVRVWAAARSQSQIQSSMMAELAGTETGLRGYWKLNNSLADSSGNGNTLTPYNGAGFFDTDLPFAAPPVSAIPFSDGFNRPDSATVGNGWTTLHGAQSPMEIKDNQLTYRGTSGLSGVYRPFDCTKAVVIDVTLREQRSSQQPGRFEHYVLTRSGGMISNGYGIVISRTDSGYNNSQIWLWQNGTILESDGPGFQFSAEVQLRAIINPDGSVTGVVTNSTGESKSFAFGPRQMVATGNDVALVVGGSPSEPFPRFDNFSVRQSDLTLGLLSHYRFDDNSANDSSGNGNHGVLHGTPQFVTGAAGKGVKLNGSTDWVDIGPNAFLSAFTLAAWVRLDADIADGADMNIMSDASTTELFNLDVRRSGSLKFRGGGAGVALSTTTPVLGQFYHVAVSYVSGTSRLYVNGVLEGTYSGTPPVLQGTPDLQLGVARGGTSNLAFFNGVIDEARIYNRILSQAEIQLLLSNYTISGSVVNSVPAYAPIIVVADGGSFTRTARVNVLGAYTIENTPSAVAYSVQAFLDINRNSQRDAWEPLGIYGANPVLLNGNLQGINITIAQLPADTDNDGMADGWEAEFGLTVGINDAAADNDGDGLTNLKEYLIGSKPNLGDSDGDTIDDLTEYMNGDDSRASDSDGDGMPDMWEIANGLNPLANDAAGDADGDGLTNAQEYNGGVSSTNPRSRDTDSNGVSDYEQRNGVKLLKHLYDRNDRLVATMYDNSAWEGWRYDGNGNILRHLLRVARDADNDGLPDAWEFAQGLAIDSATGAQGFNGDADADGWTNEQEFLAGTSATDATSHPDAAASTGATWFNPPKSRILTPPASGGAWAHVNVRLWDAEANNASVALQWWDAAANLWKPATLLKIDNASPAIASALATSPGGTTHDVLWNAIADLPTYNGTILLRTTAQDAAGTTTSESFPYSLNTTGDFDGDGMPDAWEIARGLDPNSATGNDGTTGDGDHDGLNNFGEFVFGLNVNASDAAAASSTATAINPADGKLYLTLTYRRRLDAASNGLTYAVQTSTDLITWTTNGPDIEPISTTPTGDSTTELVTVRIKPPLDGSSAKKFVQVRVTK